MKKLITIILALMLIVACEKSKKVETLPVKDTTSVVIDTTVVSDTISEEETTDEFKYFVVVGAFKAEWRADKWVSHIEKLGYTAKKVLSHNDFYIVYVKAEDDKKIALSEMEQTRLKITPRSWVYVKR